MSSDHDQRLAVLNRFRRSLEALVEPRRSEMLEAHSAPSDLAIEAAAAARSLSSWLAVLIQRLSTAPERPEKGAGEIGPPRSVEELRNGLSQIAALDMQTHEWLRTFPESLDDARAALENGVPLLNHVLFLLESDLLLPLLHRRRTVIETATSADFEERPDDELTMAWIAREVASGNEVLVRNVMSGRTFRASRDKNGKLRFLDDA